MSGKVSWDLRLWLERFTDERKESRRIFVSRVDFWAEVIEGKTLKYSS